MLKLGFLDSFREFWTIPKSRGRGLSKREALGPKKNEVLGFWKCPCVCMAGHAYACVSKNPKIDSFDGPTSNSHNSLNMNSN